MSTATLVVAATKLAGFILTNSIAANVFSFYRYRRKNLGPFQSAIDESADVLAAFDVDSASDEKSLFFGLATAPAHAEDKLDDAWLQFAKEHPCGDTKHAQKWQTADSVMASAAADRGSHQVSLNDEASDGSGKKKVTRSLKIAMEAMIRGFEKYSDEARTDSSTECGHNVTAWHNAP